MSGPSIRTALAGFAAALAAAAAAVAMIEPAFHLTPVQLATITLGGYPLALLHAVFVGGPIYLWAIARWPLRWRSAALGGFVSAVIPVAVFGLIHTLFALVDGRALTIAAWLFAIAWLGSAGVVGGLVFRAICGPRPMAAR